jgi:hypothetical protein
VCGLRQLNFSKPGIGKAVGAGPRGKAEEEDRRVPELDIGRQFSSVEAALQLMELQGGEGRAA